MWAVVPETSGDVPTRIGRWLVLSSIVFSLGLLADGFHRALSRAPASSPNASTETARPVSVAPVVGTISG